MKTSEIGQKTTLQEQRIRFSFQFLTAVLGQVFVLKYPDQVNSLFDNQIQDQTLGFSDYGNNSPGLKLAIPESFGLQAPMIPHDSFGINYDLLLSEAHNKFNNRLGPKPRIQHENFGELIFEDDFNTLDFNKWRHEITAGGGGNWEFQFYNNDRRVSFVEDGKLHIKPILTSEYLGISDEELMKGSKLDLWSNAPGMQCTANGFYGCFRETQGKNIINPIMSSQLRSVNSFSFTYGKVDIVAKLPKGDWIWPAIWLMPKHHAYGSWPTSGEINLVESRGNSDDCYGDGASTVGSVLHWGLNYTNNKYGLTSGKYKLPQGTFNDEFHKFTLEWTPQYIRTWIDDTTLLMEVEFNQTAHKFGNYSGSYNPWSGRGNSAPFDQEFYLIFNVAVGGTGGFFPESPPAKEQHKKSKACQKKYKKNYKPYNNTSGESAYEFLSNKTQWLPTWSGPNPHQSALIIDSVKVYKYNSFTPGFLGF